MINKEQLSGGQSATLKDRYRVRLFASDAVPFVYCHQQHMSEQLIVIDLPEAEGYELKVLEAQKQLQAALSTKATGGLHREDKENLPVGCELEGEPLHVTFLSIEKLDKMAAANKTRFDDGFEITSLDRFSKLDLHLMSQLEAHDLTNELAQQFGTYFADDLSQHAFIVFTEGSKFQHVFLLGVRRTTAILTTFRARYFGDFYTAVDGLSKLCSDMNKFPLRKVQCRCRFDVLEESVVVEKTGNFVPAMFNIEAEWSPDKRLASGGGSFEKAQTLYLQMPPDNASVTVKFKPGWMDGRIFLTDRINELRYLASLATHLKAGTVPWIAKNEGQDQADVIERAIQLIKSAKDKLDAQPMYPFDFADRLWDVLKNSKSVDVLRHVFQQIYEQLQTGEFHVLVEANKVSSLAKMLRMRNPAEIIFPRLEPMTCLQLLVEIGVDRFNGELSHRFLAGQFLPNTLDLEPFFQHPSAPVENRIERLIPLYLALQSMIMIELYVLLPQHEKTNVTKKLLAHFTAMEGTEAFEKEVIYKANMEDIRYKKMKDTLSDWILERTYDKYTSYGVLSKGGSLSDVVHISKNLGVKYIRPLDDDDASVGGAAGNTTIVKREPTSPIIDPPNDDAGNGDKWEAPAQQFECAYFVINSQPSALFK